MWTLAPLLPVIDESALSGSTQVWLGNGEGKGCKEGMNEFMGLCILEAKTAARWFKNGMQEKWLPSPKERKGFNKDKLWEERTANTTLFLALPIMAQVCSITLAKEKCSFYKFPLQETAIIKAIC